ncbi:hypothetical protein CWE22_10845 [Pseudidiomarina aestuarii]|uniref:Permease n=1 Tax=Pseudidiomarina aestuarii TaxID=624146 RepID=A0A7Z7ESU1_9GAMM|nr:hypothetical protein [Pseudidiomarina aestuarii]RUO39240.1 hypothetical protein CWE22_10845 [Pseudidiomarina aestuarii]
MPHNAEKIVHRTYGLLSIIFILFGGFIQITLGSVNNIQTFKLFNIFGLFLDVFGIILLSDLAINAKGKLKIFMDAVYGVTILFTFTVPLGISVFSFADIFLDLPSQSIITAFAGGLMTYLFIPLFLLDGLGDILNAKFYQTTKSRTIFIGWYLLFAGIVMQTIGAILDIFS